MTLLEIQAVRALPEKYVTAGTHIAQLGDLVIALHPELPPLAFSDGRWIVIVRNKLLDRVAKSNKKTRYLFQQRV